MSACAACAACAVLLVLCLFCACAVRERTLLLLLQLHRMTSYDHGCRVVAHCTIRTAPYCTILTAPCCDVITSHHITFATGRGTLQNGLWGIKILMIAAIAVGAFFIPNVFFAKTWAYIGLVGTSALHACCSIARGRRRRSEGGRGCGEEGEE